MNFNGNIRNHLQLDNNTLISLHIDDHEEFILHNKYYVCWFPGDPRNEGINSIDMISLEYADSSNKSVKFYHIISKLNVHTMSEIYVSIVSRPLSGF